MAPNTTRLLPKLEALKIWVQILSIVIGGVWVYWKFLSTEASLFHARAVTESWFSWVPVESTGQCRAQFQVSLTNTGKKTFEVERVLFRGWRFDWKLDSGESHHYLDFMGLEAETPFFAKEYTSDHGGPFVREYAPQEMVTHNFDMLVERNGPQWIMFKVDLFQGKKDARVSWYELRAEPICNVEVRAPNEALERDAAKRRGAPQLSR